MHGYFQRRTRDESATLDLTAETFAQAWLVRGRFRDEAAGSAAPWLFGIARNALLMSVRRGSIERRATERIGLMGRLDRPEAAAAPDPAWTDGADDLLDALPQSQREAVRLRVDRGLRLRPGRRRPRDQPGGGSGSRPPRTLGSAQPSFDIQGGLMTSLPEPLQHLGDALYAATTADMAGTRPPGRRHRRVVAALAAAVVAVPGAALAANALISASQVAQSLPQGTLALLGTHPTCTTITAGVQVDCTLTTAPSANGGPEPGQWLSTGEPTVDASQRVNGGCRSENADGTRWRCYVGEAAVHEQIIGQGFLGQHSSGPGVG